MELLSLCLLVVGSSITLKKKKKNLGGELKTPPKSILKTSSLEFTVNSTQKKKNSLAFCFQLLS